MVWIDWMTFSFFLLHFNVVQGWSLSDWWRGTCLPMESHLIVEGLDRNLSLTLFGQHLVIDPVVTAVLSHLEHDSKKALVLSFHGPPGVGKTFVAQKIAHHLFNGDTSYVRFYSGRNDFLDTTNFDVHKEILAREIKQTVQSCPYSIFIFDEANFMSDGLFGVLRPFTEYLDNYQGVDYRKATFIFLSNIGQSEIAKIYHDKVKRSNGNVKREQLKLSDFEEVLSEHAYNLQGGLKDSSLITNFLVDYYLPFLPLEESHIMQCITHALLENGEQPNDRNVRFVYDLLPKKMFENIEYVVSNCKKIASEVGRYIASQQLNARKMKQEL